MGNRIGKARQSLVPKDMTQGYVPEQMQPASESVVAQPQQTIVETPVVENPGLGAMARYKSGQTTSEAVPQSTTAVPQNTNTEAQSSNDAYNDYLRRKSRGYVDNTLTPETVEETETPVETPAEEKSGVDYLTSLYEELKPISKVEEERRLRGAASANAIAHLGNLLGALGGLYYTTKGAPAQKVADIKNPDYDAFSDRVRKQREAHAGRLRDLDKWKQQMRIAEDELALKKQNAAYERGLNELKLKLEQGKLSAQQYDNEIKKLEAEFLPKKQEAELRRINAQTGSYNSSAYANTERGRYYGRGGSGSKAQPYEFSIDGKTYTVNKNRWNDANKSELLRLAGSDGYAADGVEEYFDRDLGQRVTREKKRRMTDDEALRYAINHPNDKTREYLGWLGGEDNASSPIEDEIGGDLAGYEVVEGDGTPIENTSNLRDKYKRR